MLFRKKPVVIEAIKWTGQNCFQIQQFLGSYPFTMEPFIIHTLEGNHTASIGDWIIKGVKGEFYPPCKPDIFEQTYELVI